MAEQEQVRAAIAGDIDYEAFAGLGATVLGFRDEPFFFEKTEVGGFADTVFVVEGKECEAFDAGVDHREICLSVAVDVASDDICREGFGAAGFEGGDFFE